MNETIIGQERSDKRFAAILIIAAQLFVSFQASRSIKIVKKNSRGTKQLDRVFDEAIDACCSHFLSAGLK